MLENIVYTNPFTLEIEMAQKEDQQKRPFLTADIPDLNHKVQCFLRPGGKSFIISIGELIYNMDSGEYGFSHTNCVTMSTTDLNILDENEIVDFINNKLGY